MTFDVDYQPESEEVTIVLEDSTLLKAIKGDSRGKLTLCKNFKALADSEPAVYKLLYNLAVQLFSLE